MINEGDQAIFTLAPVQDGDNPDDFVGDPMEADCGHMCWVSPATRKMIETTQMDVKTQCVVCTMSDPAAVMALIAHGPHVAPGVVEEAAAKMGVSQADVKAQMAQYGIKETDDPRSFFER